MPNEKESPRDIIVRAPGTKFLDEIKWSEVDMDEDAFVLQMSETSSLPTHFVGRMQVVSEMIRSGVLPEGKVRSGVGLRLLQMPDLEKEVDVETASRELAEMQVDSALYDGKYTPPEPYQDLQLLIERAQNTFMWGRTLKDIPAGNLRKLERLISEASRMLQRMQPPPTAAPAAPGQPAAGGVPAQPGLPALGGPPAQVSVTGQAAVPLGQPAELPVPAVPSAAGAGV